MLSETMPEMWNEDGEGMKIAVTSQGESIDSAIDERFGRCNFFVIIDPNNMEHEILPNEAIASSGGAGIRAVQALVNKNVEALITGNIGPNAFDVLRQAGVKVFRSSGNVRDTVEKFKEGKLEEIKEANVGKHFGGIR